MDQQLPQDTFPQPISAMTGDQNSPPKSLPLENSTDNQSPPINNIKKPIFQPKFLAVLIFLFLSVPFLVFVALQNQDIRQKAFRGPDFAGGYYTNLCGGNTSYSCFADCNPATGTCSPKTDANHISRWVCNGETDNCRDIPETWSTSAMSVNNPFPGCNKTVQLDVYDKNCRDSNGSWSCTDTNLKGFMVWYSGSCANNDPTPTPDLGCTGVTEAQASVDNVNWTINNITVPSGSTVFTRPNPLAGRTAFFKTSTGLVYAQCSSEPGHGTCPNSYLIPLTDPIGTVYTLQAFEFGGSWDVSRPGCVDTLTVTTVTQPSPSPTRSPSPNPTNSPTPTPTPTPTATPTPTPTPSSIGGPVCGTSCTTNPECPTGLMCFISAGQTTGVCRNPACQTDSDCSCDIVQTNPTPIPTPSAIPTVPKAGTTWPTIMLLGTGAVLLVLGLAIL